MWLAEVPSKLRVMLYPIMPHDGASVARILNEMGEVFGPITCACKSFQEKKQLLCYKTQQKNVLFTKDSLVYFDTNDTFPH